MDLPSALVYSTQPPVSVYGTGTITVCQMGFLGNMIRATIGAPEGLPYFQVRVTPTPLNVLFRQYACLSLFRPHMTHNGSAGILTGLPSLGPFGLHLGPDLP